MNRLRLVFCVLAGLLWLPLLGLVFHALRSAEQEEAGRYQAVAERLFDEMERELTQLLEREQQRPLDDYDFGSGGPNSYATCVLGYFERNDADQLSHGAWRHSGEEIEQALSASRPLMAATTPSAVRDQAPGSTQALAQLVPPSKTYDALSSLNRGVWSRSQGESRRGVSSIPRTSGSAAAPPPELAAKQLGYPLRAVPGSEHFLILVRSVPRAGSSVLQGLVIDPRALLDWVRARSIPEGELQQAAELTFLDPSARSAAVTASADRRYRHRFGEPFSSLSAQLELKRLVDLETGDYVYVLSGLLVLLGALGLIGGYRMVAAIVGYAERRSNFVSAVTHELKTPLTSIRMYGEMLRDEVVPDPEKRSRYYRIITAESERLTRLIDNVLELAKLERGSRQLSLTMGHVGQVVRDTLEVLEPHATELGFQLELEEEATLPAVSFDRDALSQVLFNLVDNALKYGSEAQQRTIKIRCERAAEGVCIRIADRGPGVDPAHLRQIWQPFFRGERELTRKHKGTGIGLSLVRGLVQRMGGSVSGKNTNPGFEVSVTLL